jgi:type IV pilus assembly protein PilV
MSRSPPYPQPLPALQRGFSLVEVLVVILVTSFGMLGIASLQANTAKYKINSWARAAAAVQFGDLADRMRANPSQAGGRFQATGGAAAVSAYSVIDSWETQQAADLTPLVNCLTADCLPAVRATYDLLAWRAEVRRQFPQGAVSIGGNLATGVVATIAWYDRQFTDAAGDLSSSDVCVANPPTPAAAASCCPATLAAPPGVRCANMSFTP